MISWEDQQLVASDLGLPALGLLLDEERLAEKIAARAPEAGPISLRARYLRYKPGTSCLVGYLAKIGEVEVPVHAFAWGSSARHRFAKAEQRRLSAGPLGPGLFTWPELGAAVWMFPNDLELRGLRRVGDPLLRRRLLARLARGRPELWNATVEMLAYKPARRFTGAVRGENGARAVLKIYTKSEHSARPDAERSIASTPFLRLPTVIGRSERHQALMLEWVAGSSLAWLLEREELPRRELQSVGAALAELHAKPAAGLPHRDAEGADAALLALAATIERLVPERSERVRRTANALAAARRFSTDRAARVVAHGDLHADQILVAENSVGLVDLDRAALAGAEEDLGNLFGHLVVDELFGRIPPGRAANAEAEILTGYLAAGGSVPARGSLERERAGALLRLAMNPFRYRETGWKAKVERILDQVELARNASERAEARA